MWGPSRRIAAFLRQNLDLTAEQEEVAAYALLVIFLTAASVAAVAFLGWLLGCMGEALAVLFTVFVLRSFSGGAHCTSPVRCTLTSALLAPAMGKLAAAGSLLLGAKALYPAVLGGGGLATWLCWRLAPVESPAKPLTSEAARAFFRRASTAVAAGAIILQVALLRFTPVPRSLVLAVTAGLLWQVFTLTAAGHRFVAGLDKTLSIIARGGEEG
ncbi:accessory gene regulator ArgB-like protein [Desulfovirgula thermocuniculi]|uniref:accessory gene regulator ArgB-like protein n=1 Tax=Desulfovirgula thermocuniculi TaxID=348842 RepID=UPI00040E9E83|nr:accessory gene regulator B family protein [Desulfovirgula thermocuniculi]